jgi:hypothetical protein
MQGQEHCWQKNGWQKNGGGERECGEVADIAAAASGFVRNGISGDGALRNHRASPRTR